ncbi:lytic transglycosylase domain-containing protein [Planosporangium thailandense]|uniref:Lytic transglycosylase domain-containing protein n=1 Tax=Planosporangium thailandense TaxID=765197 RepID=A0ABX0Y639_9ACTN|nr:lytic transglycosylase domain-containing protein [Planosporangium thailandense]NJC73503.1 lytic transglycosylase domain-containing protein [Planosporangium thailandense]
MALLSTPRSRAIAAAAAVTAGIIVASTVLVSVWNAPENDAARLVYAAPTDSAATVTAAPSVTESATPSPTPSPSLSPTASPSPSVTRKSGGSTKQAPPPPKQLTVAKPPPPPPAGPPPGPGPTASGPVCSRPDRPGASCAEVAAAMHAAAGHAYRPTLSLDDPKPPAITVREVLIQGIGWEESGWQSTIKSADGGLGTMQVMTDTATWMNQKYGTNYDRASLTGNINVATGYLAWLVRYFGDKYFNGNYSLAGDPNKLVLLDMVISAYQAGYGAVDNAVAAGQDLPNTWYVYAVEGFMANQPWKQWL